MVLYRVFSQSPIDAASSLAELPGPMRDELTVRERPLARPPSYPPGARPGMDARLDRYARSTLAYEVGRAAMGGEPPARTAVAGLALAARLARLAGDGLILDVGAGMLLTAEEAERTRAIAEVPVGWLVTVHMVEGPDGLWIHTHGAGKLGLPELETFGVAPAVASEVGRAMHKLLERWALAGAGGSAGEDVPLPRGSARTVDAARGAARPSWAREPDEPSRRLALVHAEDGGPVSRLFSGEAERPEQPSFAERDAAQALIALARRRASAAAPEAGPGEAPAVPLPEGASLRAKVAVEDELGVDVQWLAVESWRGSRMRGRLPSGEPTEWPCEAVLGLALLRGGEVLGVEEAAASLGLAGAPDEPGAAAPGRASEPIATQGDPS
jgi:hypothetical protein